MSRAPHPSPPASAALLLEYYEAMERHYGPTHWWPGDTPFEIAIGAILTQNTAWTNVERAIVNLKRAKLLRAKRMAECPAATLEEAIRPSGYFRQKTRYLHTFARHVHTQYGGSMARMSRRPADALRAELLGLRGIGPETADDILLYACGKPVFVVDAYTRRIFSRHGLVPESIGYEALRAWFEERLPPTLHLYREYHGLIVWTGKDFCRKQPACASCPLQSRLPGGARAT